MKNYNGYKQAHFWLMDTVEPSFFQRQEGKGNDERQTMISWWSGQKLSYINLSENGSLFCPGLQLLCPNWVLCTWHLQSS